MVPVSHRHGAAHRELHGEFQSTIAAPWPGEDPPAHTAERTVIHVVGRLTEVVFSFLKPATDSLAQSGVAQTIILIDDPAHRHLLPWLDPGIRLAVVPLAIGPVRRLIRWQSALAECLERDPDAAVHLHGAVPSLFGVLRRSGGPRLFSPHGSKSLGPLRLPGRALYWLLGAGPGTRRQRVVASAESDAMRLRGLTDQPVELIESPVDAVFFDQPRRPAAAPLVVATCRDQRHRAAALFAQCAVLLGQGAVPVAFEWQGQAPADALARLAAAGVGLHPDIGASARAGRFAEAWAFVAPIEARGFPVHVAEAMAAGLPCVVRDGPYHRDVIEDGATGFLCQTDGDLLARVAELIASPTLRQRIGEAARSAAARRFDGSRFRDSVRGLYEL